MYEIWYLVIFTLYLHYFTMCQRPDGQDNISSIHKCISMCSYYLVMSLIKISKIDNSVSCGQVHSVMANSISNELV